MAAQDGATVAVLLEGASIGAGDPWWVHQRPGEVDLSYGTDDHRRNWRQGRVASCGEQCFEVELAVGRQSLHKSLSETVSVPLPQRIDDPQALVTRGCAELRCMDWPSLTGEIMTGAICGASADGQLAANQLYQLSRTVPTSELIEFFLTHSWHDDACLKWTVLQAFAADFQERKGRDLTLWLDKTCIDQSRIRDGLLVLPVTVMSCKKLLCLWGPSYPGRLWCVWELFTLVAFTSPEAAAKRLVVKALSDEDASDSLQAFDVRRARCYDPNEQARLLQVIGGMGLDRFNQRMHDLGASLGQRKRSSSGTASLLGWIRSRTPRSRPVAKAAVEKANEEKANEVVDESGFMHASALSVVTVSDPFVESVNSHGVLSDASSADDVDASEDSFNLTI